MKNSIKKVIAGLSVAAMFASVMPIVSAWYDDEVDASDFKVREVNGGVTIEEYVGPSSDEIIIPEEIDGKKVVLIDTLAFASVSNDVKIYVPESVNAQKSGWKPFLTAGAVNKGILENVPEGQKDPIGIIQYWGKVAEVDENKLTTNYIKQQINDAINKVVGKATGLVPDLGDDPFASLDTIIEKLPDPGKLKELKEKLDTAVNDLSDLKIDLNDKEYQGLDVAELAAKVNVKIDDATAKVTEATNNINVELEKIKDNSEKINAEIKKLNELKDSLENKLDPAKFEEEIRKMITEEAIFNTIYNGPDKLVEKIKENLEMGDSLSSIALNEIKEYKESPADYIAGWKLSEANTKKLKKAIDKIELVAEKLPHIGITLLSTEDNTALKEYAANEGITFEVGEPVKKAVETSIVYSEVPGETSIVVSEVEGSTYTSIVEVPGSTYTSIVEVPQSKETVTSIVTSIVTEVSVSVSIQTVYVTESTTETTKKDILKGDAANLNGKIELKDIMWIAQYLLHPKEDATEDQIYAADFNDDGKISLIQDLIPVAKIYLKNMTSK